MQYRIEPGRMVIQFDDFTQLSRFVRNVNALDAKKARASRYNAIQYRKKMARKARQGGDAG